MIKDRIIELIECKEIAKESFYIKIGMTSASFRGKAKKSPLNSIAIENILSEIPDVNPIWLLTGEGEMLKHEAQNTSAKDKIIALQDEIIALQAKLYNKEKLIQELQTEIDNLKKALANAENARTANAG